MAQENRDWGYRRIQGALSNLDTLARSTIADILERHGIEPAPERNRKTTWKEFLTRHWELIVAADSSPSRSGRPKDCNDSSCCFSSSCPPEEWRSPGSPRSHGLWMSQIGRNLTDSVDGMLPGKRYLIHDRDPLFTDEFLGILKDAGVKSVKLPPRTPNLNADAERFVRSIKESCLERLILFGESSLRTAVQNFVAQYHPERNHQGLNNRLIQPEPDHLKTLAPSNAVNVWAECSTTTIELRRLNLNALRGSSNSAVSCGAVRIKRSTGAWTSRVSDLGCMRGRYVTSACAVLR